MKLKSRRVARAAIIAAVYTLITIAWPLSFGQMQIRLSEALTILPIFLPEAIPGLFVGCLLSGIFAGMVWFDVVFGSLTTLLAAYLTRRLGHRKLLAPLPPVLLNALIVGCVVHFAHFKNATLAALPISMLSVGVGEFIACYGLGMPLRLAFDRLPARFWE